MGVCSGKRQLVWVSPSVTRHVFPTIFDILLPCSYHGSFPDGMLYLEH